MRIQCGGAIGHTMRIPQCGSLPQAVGRRRTGDRWWVDQVEESRTGRDSAAGAAVCEDREPEKARPKEIKGGEGASGALSRWESPLNDRLCRQLGAATVQVGHMVAAAAGGGVFEVLAGERKRDPQKTLS